MSDVPQPTFATRATLFLRLNTADSARSEIAWEEFHERYARVIAGFARKMGAKPQEIEDVIQDVMLGFFAIAPTFEYDPARGRFRGYLKVCTFRALRDRFRNRLKLNAIPLEQISEDDQQIEDLWEQSWVHELLDRAVAAVRKKYDNNDTFRAFEMHVLHNRPVDSVATELGMQVASVYKAKQRITAAIHEAFRLLQEQEG